MEAAVLVEKLFDIVVFRRCFYSIRIIRMFYSNQIYLATSSGYKLCLQKNVD